MAEQDAADTAVPTGNNYGAGGLLHGALQAPWQYSITPRAVTIEMAFLHDVCTCPRLEQCH
jgi:hypothetical protein